MYHVKFGIKQSLTGYAVNKSWRKKPIRYIRKTYYLKQILNGTNIFISKAPEMLYFREETLPGKSVHVYL